jgi:tetratricopeptide (TPR) repeat protein
VVLVQEASQIGLQTAEKAELYAFYQTLKSVKTQAFTLQECRELVAQNDKQAFRADRINWLRAIQQHPLADGVEIATQLFEFYFVNEDTERSKLMKVWENLANKAQNPTVDQLNLSMLWRQMGILETGQGHFERAQELFEKAIQIVQKIGNTSRLGDDHFELGLVYRNLGDYQNAWRTFEKSVAYAREAGNTKTVIYSQGQLANLLAVQSRFSEAIEILKSSLQEWGKFPLEADRNMSHTSLHTLGRTYVQNGQYQEAKEALKESLYLKELINERFDATQRTRATLAEACINLGEFQEAGQYLQEDDVEKLTRMGSYLYAASSFKALSQLNFAQGNYQESRRLADRALDVADQSNNPLTQFEVLLWILPTRLRRFDIPGFISLLPRFGRAFFRLRLSPLEFIKLVLKRLAVTLNPLRLIRSK